MFWTEWFNIDPHHILRSFIVGTFMNVVAGFIYAAVLYLTIFKKMLICQEKWCFRIGHHKVQGTHFKTCNKHLCQETHDKLREKYKTKYPEQHKILMEQK